MHYMSRKTRETTGATSGNFSVLQLTFFLQYAYMYIYVCIYVCMWWFWHSAGYNFTQTD